MVHDHIHLQKVLLCVSSVHIKIWSLSSEQAHLAAGYTVQGSNHLLNKHNNITARADWCLAAVTKFFYRETSKA